MELYCLVYVSKRAEDCTDDDIQKILTSCEKNNPKKSITGILMHSGSRFIQYIEGDKNEVSQLFDRIKEDNRHQDVKIMHFERISERLFPSWNMGYKDVNTELLEFNTKISGKDLAKFEGLIQGNNSYDNEGLRLLQLFFES